MSRITRAVIPVAGFGTRLLPLTKGIPKEFLPVGRFPAVHYVVEEAQKAGIKEIIFIVSPGRTEIKKYFSRNYRLETFLASSGNRLALQNLHRADFDLSFTYVLQRQPKGLSDAIRIVKTHLKGDPFALLLPDEILFSSGRSTLTNMIDDFENTGKSVVAVKKVPISDAPRYGIVAFGDDSDMPLLPVLGAVEKPSPNNAPSNMAIIGRYVFAPDFHEELFENEGDLTGIIDALAKKGRLLARVHKGRRFDLGKFADFVEANKTWERDHAAID